MIKVEVKSLLKQQLKDMKILNIVLKTDVNGSLEAIKSSIQKMVNEEEERAKIKEKEKEDEK